MSKQVPEGNVPSREEQLSSLRLKLIGNKVFKACRGKMDPTLGRDLFFWTVEKSNSPTQFCSDWDELMSNLRVMGNLLAVYRRDCWTDAYNALKNALTNPYYLLPGETFSLDETVPYTLFMFHPESTFALINWLLNVPWKELRRCVEEKNGVTRACHPLTYQLFEHFPFLQEADWAKTRTCSFEDVEADILVSAWNKKGKATHGEVYEAMNSVWASGRILNQDQQPMDHLRARQLCIADLSRRGTAELLGHFSREQQKHMATWSFDVPKAIMSMEGSQMCYNCNHKIGLHPESEHEKWRKLAPAMVSRNVSCGYGAVLEPFDLKDYGYELSPRLWDDKSRQGEEMVKRFTL